MILISKSWRKLLTKAGHLMIWYIVWTFYVYLLKTHVGSLSRLSYQFTCAHNPFCDTVSLMIKRYCTALKQTLSNISRRADEDQQGSGFSLVKTGHVANKRVSLFQHYFSTNFLYPLNCNVICDLHCKLIYLLLISISCNYSIKEQGHEIITG